MQCRKNFKKAMFQVNLFIVFNDLNLNLRLKNTNSPPIARFDLDPTCEFCQMQNVIFMNAHILNVYT